MNGYLNVALALDQVVLVDQGLVAVVAIDYGASVVEVDGAPAGEVDRAAVGSRIGIEAAPRCRSPTLIVPWLVRSPVR